MSPVVWQVLEGRDALTLTLLDVEDEVDSGDVWQNRRIQLAGTELNHEIDERVFAAEMELMTWALDHCDREAPVPQTGEPSFYPRRRPEDSRIDPERSIKEQFDLLRVCDPQRYPAFFELRGRRYTLHLEAD